MAYRSVAALEQDLRLIFNNARQFNMDGSEPYADATALERAMEKHLQVPLSASTT